MRRMMMAVLGAVMLAAACAVAAGETVAFGNRVVSVGDSVGRVRDAAGNPTRVVTLYNRLGAPVGERWEYEVRGKTVLITITQGRVVAIDEVY